jgi:hypothetical protein
MTIVRLSVETMGFMQKGGVGQGMRDMGRGLRELVSDGGIEVLVERNLPFGMWEDSYCCIVALLRYGPSMSAHSRAGRTL